MGSPIEGVSSTDFSISGHPWLRATGPQGHRASFSRDLPHGGAALECEGAVAGVPSVPNAGLQILERASKVILVANLTDCTLEMATNVLPHGQFNFPPFLYL